MDSILTSIKKLLGIQETYTNFDEDIIIHINTAFATLNQLGVGPVEGFMIEDSSEVWTDYITECNLTMVKSYIFLKVKLLFDPPTNTPLLESIKANINEMEWRLNVIGDSKNNDG